MHNNKSIALFLCFWALPLYSVFAGDLSNQSLARNAHPETISEINLKSLGSTSLRLELNAETQLEVQLISALAPEAFANIDWRISQNTGDSNRQKAYFVTDDSQSTTLDTRFTNEDGISSITLNTGEIASTFTVTASASIILNDSEPVTVSQTFQISVGIQASIVFDTPENEVALTFDIMCPKLAANTLELSTQAQALLQRCNAFQQSASEGKSEEVSNALREISPEEVAVQSAIGSGFGSQQMSNVASRLTAIRRGTRQLSFNNLGLRYGGRRIPISYILKSLLTNDEQDHAGIGSLLNNRLSLFANGNISLGNRASTTKEDGFSFDSYNITAGADYRLKSTTFVGMALGGSQSKVSINQQGGESSANGYSLNLYGNHYINKYWYIDGLINIGSLRFDMKRNINFELAGSTVNRVANSETKGSQQGISIGSGYDIHDGALSATFFGKLYYSQLTIDEFTESGAQELDLRIDQQSTNNSGSSIGAQLQFAHSTRWGVFIPFIGFSWEHEFNDSNETISGAFVSDQSKSAFNITTDKADTNYFSSVQGITAILPRGISAYIKIENILGRNFYSMTNISFGGRLELQF